jgi:hypothetical protein
MRHEPNLGDKKSVADIFMSMLKAEGPLTLFDTAILVSGAAASSSSVLACSYFGAATVFVRVAWEDAAQTLTLSPQLTCRDYPPEQSEERGKLTDFYVDNDFFDYGERVMVGAGMPKWRKQAIILTPAAVSFPATNLMCFPITLRGARAFRIVCAVGDAPDTSLTVSASVMLHQGSGFGWA